MLKIESIQFARKEFKLEIDLILEKGRINTLLGPSGCGKTTLLRIIAGLERADSGRIIWAGRDISGIVPEKRNFGFVFQDFALFPHMNVEKNILFGIKKNSSFNLKATLKEMKLEGFETRMPDTLSGGEKQRIALVRALASEPEIILMDEPLSSLDASLRISLRKMIKQVQRETGVTMIYVTHDQEEALWLSDRLVVMNQGSLVESGSPENIYYSPNHLFSASFLGDAILLPVEDSVDNEHLTSEGYFFCSDKKNNKSGEFLFFRQKWMKVAKSNEGKNVISGRVNSLDFSGEFFHVSLLSKRNNNYSLTLPYEEGKKLKKGDPLSLSISPEKCRLIKA